MKWSLYTTGISHHFNFISQFLLIEEHTKSLNWTTFHYWVVRIQTWDFFKTHYRIMMSPLQLFNYRFAFCFSVFEVAIQGAPKMWTSLEKHSLVLKIAKSLNCILLDRKGFILDFDTSFVKIHWKLTELWGVKVKFEKCSETWLLRFLSFPCPVQLKVTLEDLFNWGKRHTMFNPKVVKRNASKS